MNNKYIKMALVALLIEMRCMAPLQAQNIAINNSGIPAVSSAILDLSNANINSLGFLTTHVSLDSATDVSTIPSPATGMLVWNTNAAMTGGFGTGFYYWTGTQWYYVNNNNGYNISGSGTANYLSRFTSANTLGTGVAQDNGLGVSISPTVLIPANMLDVNGSAAFGTYAGTAAPTNGFIVSGQVGIGTNAPDGSAALDIVSTTQGFLPPRMSSAQMNAISGPVGLIVLNNTTNCLELYTGSAWQNLSCPCNSAPEQPGAITGNTVFCAGASGIVYSVLQVANTNSYTWTVPAGATITANSQTSITVTFGSSSGNITVTASNSCGTSEASALAITIYNGPPSAPAVPLGSTDPTTGTLDAYTIAAVANATGYRWTSSNTNVGIIQSQSATSAVVLFSASAGTTNLCVYDSNRCGNSSPSCLAITSSTCPHGTATFNYAASIQSWAVPSCISQVTVVATAGAGGTGDYAGGDGAVVTATVSVNGGDILGVVTGGEGVSAPNTTSGGAGGGSFVWDMSSTSYPLVAAGGGGGGAYSSVGLPGSTTTAASASNGGSGGGLAGTNGTNGTEGDAGGYGPGGGGGGWNTTLAEESPTAPGNPGQGGAGEPAGFPGGEGGTSTNPEANGGFGGGGGGGYNSSNGEGGGGGGGGYNGGGGGNGSDPAFGGGGGGSGYYNGSYPYTNGADFVSPVTATQTSTGNGSVVIYY